MAEVKATLLFLVRDGQVCFAEKQKKIGAGRLNGFGGKVEPGETIEQAMIRETEEEIGITPTAYKQMGEVLFHNPSDDEAMRRMRVYVFTATEWTGEPAETDEMKRPVWYGIDQVPYDKMLAGDQIWLPYVLQGRPVKAFIRFNDDWSLAEQRVERVEEF